MAPGNPKANADRQAHLRMCGELLRHAEDLRGRYGKSLLVRLKIRAWRFCMGRRCQSPQLRSKAMIRGVGARP